MIRINNDYNQGACDAVLTAIQETNSSSYGGYGNDEWCEKGVAEIKKYLDGIDVEIHFMVGGTQTNCIVIDAALRPYQSVISADCGHIHNHEAGSIEHTGHKILALPAVNGKLTAEAIAEEAEKYQDSNQADYLTEPKLVFLSSPSEYGTVYSKEELTAIHKVCKKYGMYLYLDGARLSYWLCSEVCDVTLADIARLVDVFYIGGTKCGAFLGEALILVNPVLRDHFRAYMKQSGGMLAKGWLLGLQFYTLFKDGLYFEMAREANKMAMQLKSAFQRAKIPFFVESWTNQQFVVLTIEQADYLAQYCIYEKEHKVDKEHLCVRFCTSWSTKAEEIEELIKIIENL